MNTDNMQPVETLKGIGEKTAKLFEKVGVRTVDDLLHYYPRGYDTFEEPKPMGALADNLIENVKYKVEEFTGMPVEKINIYVEGVRVID